MAIEYTKTMSINTGALTWADVGPFDISEVDDPSGTTYIVKYLSVYPTSGFATVYGSIGAVQATFQNDAGNADVFGPTVSFTLASAPIGSPIEMINGYTAPFSNVNPTGSSPISRQITTQYKNLFITLGVAGGGALAVTVSCIKIVPTAVVPYSMFAVQATNQLTTTGTSPILSLTTGNNGIVKDITISNADGNSGADATGRIGVTFGGGISMWISPLFTISAASGFTMAPPIYLVEGATVMLGLASNTGNINATVSYEISP